MQKYSKTAEEVDKLKKHLGRQAVPPQLRARLEKDDEAPKEESDGKLRLENMNLRQWQAWIPEETADDTLEYLEDKLLPWLRVSEKMGVHIHMQATAITAMHRKGNANQSVAKLTERVAPVVALKEDVDDHLSKLCTKALEKLEKDYKVGINGEKNAE